MRLGAYTTLVISRLENAAVSDKRLKLKTQRVLVISSSNREGDKVTHGLELGLRAFSGAHAVRVINAGNTVVCEHSHDWPVLSLYVLGDYWKTFDGGVTKIAGPSAVLHGAGLAHSNRLCDAGLEQIDLQFDPRWLRGEARPSRLEQVRCWTGGAVAAAGSRLASMWSTPGISEEKLAHATGQFIDFALVSRNQSPPKWLPLVLNRLQVCDPPTALDLAKQVGLHPTWLAQAYRVAMGEGIRQTVRRKRVEQATLLLRRSEWNAAEVAAAAGFCDQSHMIRAFRQLLGRTPAQVRFERSSLGVSSHAERPLEPLT